MLILRLIKKNLESDANKIRMCLCLNYLKKYGVVENYAKMLTHVVPNVLLLLLREAVADYTLLVENFFVALDRQMLPRCSLK